MRWKLFFVVVLGCLATPACFVGAQTADHLVINEVYVEFGADSSSWMEVHNPSSDTLFLLGIHAQYVKCANFLAGIAMEYGGVAVPPGRFVVLCYYLSTAEQIEGFRELWRIPQNVLIIPAFDAPVANAYYMEIWGCDEPKPGDPSYGLPDAPRDHIWVGGQTETTDNVQCAGSLPWTCGLCAFSRREDGLDTDDCQTDFVEGECTPGRPNVDASELIQDTWGQIKDQ